MSFTLREKFIFSKEKKKTKFSIKKTEFFFLKIISPIMEYTVYLKNNS